MKLLSAPLDDIHQEVKIVLQSDGGRLARVLLFLLEGVYGSYNSAMLLLLRWHNRRDHVYRYPGPRREPLNPDRADIADAWKESGA